MKTNQKGFAALIAVLIVLSLAAVAAGAYVYFYVAPIARVNPLPVVQKTNEKPAEAQNAATTTFEQNAVVDAAESDQCVGFVTGKKMGSNGTDQAKLPVDCRINIGEGFENWRFAILPQKLRMIDVRNENGSKVQSIPIGDQDLYDDYIYDWVFYGDVDYTNDINFDGYRDLRVLNIRGANVESYNYWFFNPISKKFEQDPVLTNIPFAVFDGKNKIITGSIYSNLNGTYQTTFNFVNGKYEVGESKIISIGE